MGLQVLPGMVGPAGAYGLVGMGAVFAGAGRAPITAVLIIFELTATVDLARTAHTTGLPGNPVGTARGLGFVVGGPGVLRSAQTFGHGGASGTYYWVDPIHELVIVFLSAHWRLDRRILASVVDTIIAECSASSG